MLFWPRPRRLFVPSQSLHSWRRSQRSLAVPASDRPPTVFSSSKVVESDGHRSEFHIRLCRSAIEMNVHAGAAPAQQSLAGIGNRSDSRQSPQTLLQVAAKLHRLRIVVARKHGIDTKEQKVFGLETGIDVAKILQRAHKQPSANSDENRQCDLRDTSASPSRNHRIAEVFGSAEGLSLSVGFTSTRAQRRAGASPKRMPVTNVDADRERKDAKIGFDDVRKSVVRTHRREARDGVYSPDRDQNSKYTANRREKMLSVSN